MPYLMLKNSLEFISFMEKVFGAALLFSKYREDNRSLMHGELKIDGSTIMFTEANEDWKPAPANLFIYVPDADEAYRKALQTGAVSIMQPEDRDYGRSCGIEDPFGNVWWITSAIA